MKSKSSGFTLIETIVSITLLTLLMMLTYQSLSIFLSAVNKNNSQFDKIKQEIELKIKLRSSLRSMMDYYYQSPDAIKKQHYVLFDKMNLRYVSLSPVLLENEKEVAVWLAVVEGENSSRLKLVECPLSEVLPTYDQLFWEPTKACDTTNFSSSYENIEFNIVWLQTNQSDTHKRDEFSNSIELDHLLPSIISLHLTSRGEVKTLTFHPLVENIEKYKQGRGYDFEV